MSLSSYAYAVIGVKLEDIGKIYDETRHLPRYDGHTGRKYEVAITQTVVELFGQKIPDEPDVKSPVWNGFDYRWGTKPEYNLRNWLISHDKRWESENCVSSLKVLGILVAESYDSGYRQEINEIEDISNKKILAEELLKSIGYKGEVKLYLYARIC